VRTGKVERKRGDENFWGEAGKTSEGRKQEKREGEEKVGGKKNRGGET